MIQNWFAVVTCHILEDLGLKTLRLLVNCIFEIKILPALATSFGASRRALVCFEAAVTDSSLENRYHCVTALECIFSILRALRMETCLSSESSNPLPSSPFAASVKRKKPLKKKVSSWSSFNDEIPGRLFANSATEIASLYTQKGKKGTDQDAMLVWEILAPISFR